MWAYILRDRRSRRESRSRSRRRRSRSRARKKSGGRNARTGLDSVGRKKSQLFSNSEGAIMKRKGDFSYFHGVRFIPKSDGQTAKGENIVIADAVLQNEAVPIVCDIRPRGMIKFIAMGGLVSHFSRGITIREISSWVGVFYIKFP